MTSPVYDNNDDRNDNNNNNIDSDITNERETDDKKEREIGK